MDDPFDEDADLRQHLAAFGPDALADLKRILEEKTAPIERRSCGRSWLDPHPPTSPR